MHRVEDCTPKKTWFALQTLNDAYPQETEEVLSYLTEVTGELAKMTEFLREQYRHRDVDQDWLQAKKRIEKACSLMGLKGEKILADCGPEMEELS
jgi:hypothetical protein